MRQENGQPDEMQANKQNDGRVHSNFFRLRARSGIRRNQFLRALRRSPLVAAGGLTALLALLGVAGVSAAGLTMVEPHERAYPISLGSALAADYAPWPGQNPRQQELDAAIIAEAARDQVLRQAQAGGQSDIAPIELPPLPQAAGSNGQKQNATADTGNVQQETLRSTKTTTPLITTRTTPTETASTVAAATLIPSTNAPSTVVTQPVGSAPTTSLVPVNTLLPASPTPVQSALPVATLLPPSATPLLTSTTPEMTPTSLPTAAPTPSITAVAQSTVPAQPTFVPPTALPITTPSSTALPAMPTGTTQPTSTSAPPTVTPSPTPGRSTPGPTPTPGPSATPTPTNTPMPSPTDLPTSTPTDLPTSTPTDLPTPTDTPIDLPTSTPTDLPTSTPTDLPTQLIVQITQPTSGLAIGGIGQTRFQALAYDPTIGTTDGAGIAIVEFQIRAPDGTYLTLPTGTTQVETSQPYCTFGDRSGTCDSFSAAQFAALQPGNYTLLARAQSIAGAWSSWVSVTVTI